MCTTIWPTPIFYRGGNVKFENLIIDHNGFSMKHQIQAEKEQFSTQRHAMGFIWRNLLH